MFVSTMAAAISLASPSGSVAAPAQPAATAELRLAYEPTEQDGPQNAPAAPSPSAQDIVPPRPEDVPAAPPAGPAPVIALPAAPQQPPGQAPTGQQIVVTGVAEQPKTDPAMAVNEASFEVVQQVDDAVVAPMAMAYKSVVPKPVRSGLRNFLINLTEPIVALNYLLQGKPGKAGETLGRFAINSTIGIGGLIDVAKTKPFNLPHRNNGFANTLGFYGVGPGPYLFLPLVGPTTVRDLIGLGIDRAILPAAVGGPLRSPYYVLGSNTIKSLDDRVELDCELRLQRQSSNPYNTAREYYLERRKADIEALHGRVYQPKGYSLIEIMSQCAAGNQRAQTPVMAPADDDGSAPGVVRPGSDLPDAAPAPAAPAAPASPAQMPTIVLPTFETAPAL